MRVTIINTSNSVRSSINICIKSDTSICIGISTSISTNIRKIAINTSIRSKSKSSINGNGASINRIDRLGSSIGVGIIIGICNSSVSIITASAAASV